MKKHKLLSMMLSLVMLLSLMSAVPASARWRYGIPGLTGLTFDELLAMSDEEICAVSEEAAEVLNKAKRQYQRAIEVETWDHIPYYTDHLIAAEFPADWVDEGLAPIWREKNALNKLLGLPDELCDSAILIDITANFRDENNEDHTLLEYYVYIQAKRNITYQGKTEDVYVPRLLLYLNTLPETLFSPYLAVLSMTGGLEETTAPEISTDLCGDVNADGEVSLLDAVLLNKHLMLGAELSEQGRRNADVDADGTLSPVDSLNILKYLIHLLPSLPA